MDPATETLVTVGASEALTCAFLGLVNRGDEVILFDPQVLPRLPAYGCHHLVMHHCQHSRHTGSDTWSKARQFCSEVLVSA